MSWETFQAIVGTALIDREFAQLLLHQTSQALLRFNLSDDEYKSVSAIRATSLEQFAKQLDQLASIQEREAELRLYLGASKWECGCRTIADL